MTSARRATSSFLSLVFALSLPPLAARPAAAQADASAAPALPEIHIDQRCKTLSADGLAVAGAPAMLSAKFFCRLESVKTTQHPETEIANNTPHHVLATVKEQEYMLQNVTGEPVVFVVEHKVPHGWQVDSEPQPLSVSNSTAIFHAVVQPGQTVRLHVGMKTTLLGPLAPICPGGWRIQGDLLP